VFVKNRIHHKYKEEVVVEDNSLCPEVRTHLGYRKYLHPKLRTEFAKDHIPRKYKQEEVEGSS
jgi:hypothetical protein